MISLVSEGQFKKNVVIGAPNNNNVHGPNEGSVYMFTMQGKKWIEDKIFTAIYGASNEFFGFSVAISRDMLLVGGPFKDGDRGAPIYSYFQETYSGTK